MDLGPGVRFGPFEVVAPLGAGGMGEVWRARDPRLGREVALKLVPEVWLEDPERLARFEREARLLATFHHPRIAVLFGQEESSGRRALVMELVEGEPLSERLARERLPSREALGIARQVAEALEHAHAHGIVHRDLKPANVVVTAEGEAKVLDFGLGKPLSPEGGDPTSSPTLTRPGTSAGVVLGTAAYMAPEQARGRTVDRRADVWALGVLLFEMLAGARLFRGDTTTDVLAAVLASEIDWSRLPASTPPAARRLLRRCLERDPPRRLHDAADVRIEIDEALLELERPAAAGGGGLTSKPSVFRWGLAALALAAAAGSTTLLLRRPPDPAGVKHLLLRLEPRPLTMAGMALSPDGARLAYVAGGRVHVRALDGEDVRVLPEARGSRPFFSPDGASVGFVGVDELPRKVPVSGGPAVTLTDPPLRVGHCTWAPDDLILCTQPSAPKPGVLLRVPARGGPVEPVPTSDEGAREEVRWPHVLPGARAVLLTLPSPEGGSLDDAAIVVQRLDTGERREVVRGGTQATWSPTGHVVFGRGSSLHAVPFDAATLTVRSAPVPVVEHVSRDTVQGGRYALAGDGTLVYVRQVADERPLVWVDRRGWSSHIETPPHTFLDPRVSPDGSRIAVQGADGDNDIWIHDMERGLLSRLTTDAGEDETPVWSPDGEWVAWVAQRSGRPRQVMRRRADGSGEEQALWTADRHAHLHDWSPDGKALLVTQESETAARDVLLVPLGGGDARPLLRAPFEECNPRFSPDGRWLVWSSDESGRFEVYVARLPGIDARAQVSVGGGDRPVWSASGREILFRSADGQVASVRFTPGPGGAPGVGRPVALFPDRYGAATGRTTHVDYDAHPDGSRFVMVGRRDDQMAALGVIVHWSGALKRLEGNPTP